jgi:hypothetical protein
MIMLNLRRSSAIGFALSLCCACGSDSGSTQADVPPFVGAFPDAPTPASTPNAPAAPPAAEDPATPAVPPPASTPQAPVRTEGTPDLPIAQPEQPADPAGGEGAGAEEPPTEDPAAGPEEPAANPDLPPGVDPNFFIFLTFGQSNMEGYPAPQAQDLAENPRVKVLAYDNCQGTGRVYNEWYTASPPLHSCRAAVGPGDYFGKALADALPPEVTIGIVGNAISGVDIDFFRKGVRSARRDTFRIPPDNQKTTAYDMIIERGRLAQQVGVIKGIIFHQGESDAGQPNRDQWSGKVQEIVADLRADLGIGNVPFLAGELLYANQNGSAGNAMNPLVDALPTLIPEAYIVSADGLGEDTSDTTYNLHFNLVAQREFGRRYGQVMLGALGR